MNEYGLFASISLCLILKKLITVYIRLNWCCHEHTLLFLSKSEINIQDYILIFTFCELLLTLHYDSMKVNLIKRKTIEQYAVAHARSRNSLRIWLTLLKMADWVEPEDIKETFATADLLGNGSERIVFDIAGNHDRVICKYHFGVTKVHLFIKWIGTHAEYTKLCNGNKQYTITDF